MNEIIRTVRAEEWDEFLRFLELCYGHSRDYFPRYLTQLYRAEDEALSSFLVLEKDRRIVSHVGLFPLEIVSFGTHVTVGGIGGVATLPEERGKGHMSRLLNHAAEIMRERGWPLSVLWGDRQRYHAFGWEIAGVKYSLYMTVRSFDRAKVGAAKVRETSLEEATPVVGRIQSILPLRVNRKHTDLNLRKQGIRIWTSDEGYVLSSGEAGSPRILEVASPEKKEPELVRGVMERCYGDSASLYINAFDSERLGRLLRATSEWTLVPEGQFRIIELAGLLESFERLLSERAKIARDFEVSIGLRLRDRVDIATISVKGGEFRISRGRKSVNHIELDERDGVRSFLGGPSADLLRLGGLTTILPLPIHVPSIDHV